jgi:short-subunit dehydrogenase
MEPGQSRKLAVVTGASSGIGFALALRNELKDTGITITSLMPGATETEFFERADMEDTKVGAAEKDDPAEVAREKHREMAEPGSAQED